MILAHFPRSFYRSSFASDICDLVKPAPKAFRPPPDWAHRGEMTKTVLSILPAGGRRADDNAGHRP
jgi:hypothetical protein